jgi:filamentous hemagglutinin family protein
MWRATSVLALVGMLIAPPGVPVALAAPSGEQVVRGQVDFQRQGDLTLITASDGSIINYDGLDILRHETVQFVQPDQAARVLNRVLGVDPTQIDGSLLANGLVYIVNPAGVFFGGEAIIDVGGLIAAAGNLSNADFLAGVDRFTDLTGPVENRGVIEAGAVALLGRTVANHGSIVARRGTIAMVAGENVLLTTLGGRITVLVDGVGEDPGTPGIENSGTVDAAAGEVVFTTGDMYSLALNHTGITRGGRIQVAGGAGGLVQVSGALDASDTSPGATGGRVEVLGEQVALLGARIDASGDAGGGEVLIGGDLGGGGDLPAARRSYVDPDTEIRADALSDGDGGKVIVWADEATGFYGEISARGGANGGDGGFAEVSGKDALVFRGDVDLGANAGSTGTLLLDPQDLVIQGGATNAGGGAGSDDSLDSNGVAPDGINFPSGDPTTTITEQAIEALTANVVLEATNSISVTGDFTNDADGAGADDPGADVVLIANGNDLTLRTRNSTGDGITGIDLTGSSAGTGLEFKTTGAGSISIETGSNGLGGGGTETGAAPVALSTLTTAGGAITVNAEGDMTVGAVDAGAGAVNLSSTLGSILDDGDDATAIAGRNVTLTANGLGQSIGAAATPSDDIDVSLGRALTASASTGAGGIFITADTDILVDTVDAGSGSVVLEATAGSINDLGNDLDVDIRARAVTLRALDEIGGRAGPISIDALDALDLGGVTRLTLDTHGSFDVGTSGILRDLAVTVDPGAADNTYNLVDNVGAGTPLTFAVQDSGADLTVVDVRGNAAGTGDLNFALTADSGDIDVVTVDAGAGAVTMEATAGSIEERDVDANHNIVTTGAVTLVGANGIGNSSTFDLGGVTDLTLDTDGSFDVSTSGILTDLAVTVDPAGGPDSYLLVDNDLVPGSSLTFDVTDDGADLTVLDVRGNAAGTGDLNFALTADSGDIDVVTVDAGTGSVTLEATAGSILNDRDDATTIAGGLATLIADESVGRAAAFGELDTAVDTLVATAAAGGVFVGESDGLTLLSVTSEDRAGTPNASNNVSVRSAAGDITVGSISSAHNVILEAPAGSILDDGSHVTAITGGEMADGQLRIVAAGQVTTEVAEGGFDVISVTQRDASGDVDIARDGGGPDVIVIEGEVGKSTIVEADTRSDGVSFHYALEDGESAVVIETGVGTATMKLGAAAFIESDGDIVLGTGTYGGVAIQMDPEQDLTLIAGADGDGGAILDGVKGGAFARIDMGGSGSDEGGLILDAPDGIGAEGDPIGTQGIGRLAAFTFDGGISIENVTAPDVDPADMSLGIVTNATPGGAAGTLTRGRVFAWQSGGNISLANAAGSITIAGPESGSPVFPVIWTSGEGDAGVTLEASEIVFGVSGSSTGNPVVRTTGSQTYEGSVVLREDTVLESDRGNVVFTSTVDSDPGVVGSAQPTLTVKAWDTTSFEAEVGGLRALGGLTTLSTDALQPGVTQIDGGSVTTKGAQSYGNAVSLGAYTTFTAETVQENQAEGVARREGSVTFDSTLDGVGAEVNADGKIGFGGDVGTTALLSGLKLQSGLEANPPQGVELGIDFTGAEQVLTGDEGIWLNASGRQAAPDRATIYSRTGPVSFDTSGEFKMGEREKLTVVGDLVIGAESAYLGDLSAMDITVDAESITLLDREAGDVLLPNGSIIRDRGMDVAANTVTFTSAPSWDDAGTTPIIATATGAVSSPGGLENVELRLLRPGGGPVTNERFVYDSGVSGEIVLDLAAAGPTALGNPASETVRLGEGVAPFQEARIGQGQPSPPTQASAEEILAFLECAPLAEGAAKPGECAGRTLPPVLETERAVEVAALYRQLISEGQPSAGVRDALRGATEHYRQRFQTEEVDGSAFRAYLEVSTNRVDRQALAQLNRLTAFSTQLGLLGLAERDFRDVERGVLEDFASRVGAPGLSAEALAQAVSANFPGLFP